MGILFDVVNVGLSSDVITANGLFNGKLNTEVSQVQLPPEWIRQSVNVS